MVLYFMAQKGKNELGEDRQKHHGFAGRENFTLKIEKRMYDEREKTKGGEKTSVEG